jgi:hypothetical protein
VAAGVPDIFSDFYFVRNHKIAINSETIEAEEKNKHRFVIILIKKIL